MAVKQGSASVGVSDGSVTVASTGPSSAARKVKVTIGAGRMSGHAIATPRSAANGRLSMSPATRRTFEWLVTVSDGSDSPIPALVISSSRALGGIRWSGRRGAE
ncbi:MAG: hypothetical protein ACLQA5_15230 [Solirubrobacteraceae bacterium]